MSGLHPRAPWRDVPVPTGCLAVHYLAQAGFVLQTARTTLALDLYLSDCCERMFDFKRLIPAPVAAAEVGADFYVSTHAHADHLDPDSFPAFAADPAARFVGARDCGAEFDKLGLARERYALMGAGETARAGDFTLRGIAADHGELAPDAIGILFTCDAGTVYAVGDTGPAYDAIERSLAGVRPDMLLVPINGAFGNLNEREACELARRLRPQVVIASHFGMFAAHNGDPAKFLAAAKTLPAGIRPVVMAPGTALFWSKGN